MTTSVYNQTYEVIDSVSRANREENRSINKQGEARIAQKNSIVNLQKIQQINA